MIDQLITALQPLDYALAFWEGGEAGFDRVDDWSDVDLQLMVTDDRVEDTFEVVDATLQSLTSIALKYRLADPTWHGHAHYDLPEEAISRLAPLYFPKDLNDLRKKRSAAAAWFWEVLEGLDIEKIKQKTG